MTTPISKATKKRRIPKQQRAKKTVETILNTAAEFLAVSADTKLSTHKIAKQAGISVGSVYQFFPNIESIEMALVGRVMDKFYDHLVEMFSAEKKAVDLYEVGERLITATVDFYHQHPETVQSIIDCRNSEAFHKVNDALNAKIIELVTKQIIEGGYSDTLPQLTRKVTIGVAISDIMTMLIWTSQNQEDRDAYLEEWKTLTRIYTKNYIKE